MTQSRITMMPEGPEVRTLVDQLQGGVGMRLLDINFLSGRYVRHGKPTGFDKFSQTMTPLSQEGPNVEVDIIQQWNAKGKFIYMVLDNGAKGTSGPDFQRSIWVTLGMSGRFVSEQQHEAEKDGRAPARWCLSLMDAKSGRKRTIYYHDPRNFGTLKLSLSADALAEKLNSLGPDILEPSTSEDSFLGVFSKTKPAMNICKFLMNQSKLAGVGNYILAEGLYRAGIDPFASLEEINETQQRALFRELKSVALESYNAQGLSRQGGSYRDVEGNRGRFEFELQCYGREFCARGNPVVRETEGPHGRTIWYTSEQLFKPRSLRYGSTADSSATDDDGDDDVSVLDATDVSDPSSVLISNLLSGLEAPGWRVALSNCTSTQSFADLADFIDKERHDGATIYPPEADIFSALNLCPLDKVKVVIVGQDPYHGRGQGHGLAFSVRKGVRPPPSLKNIFKEAINDVDIASPQHGNLESWARQGVLLLNTVLTVREGEANSHAGRGWEEFTDAVIDILNQRDDGLVFLLWGKPAAKKASGVDGTRHAIIKTSHPSPLGATKTKSPFLGSCCFSETNKRLKEFGKEAIDWNVV